MANGDPLPEGHQVTRGCSRGYDSGEITATAFELRKSEQQKRRISVDWVECPYVDPGERDLNGSVARMQERVDPPYAVLGVTDIRRIEIEMCAPDVQEFGNNENPSHSAITGFTTDTHVDLKFQMALAEIANQYGAIS